MAMTCGSKASMCAAAWRARWAIVRFTFKCWRSFANTSALRSAALQQALVADDRVLAERQAHTLRGAAALVGAGAIQALAAELETAIHGGAKQPALQPLIDQLDRALQALMAQLASFTLR